MISDREKWIELKDRAQAVNREISAMKEFAIEHGLVLSIDDDWLKVFGKGHMEHWDDNPTEVWQDSAYCSEFGYTNFPYDIAGKLLTPVPGAPDRWHESDYSTDHWNSSGTGC